MFAKRKVLVTGASRGIGLELCKQFKAQQASVIAVCRQSNSELKKLGVRVIDGCSVQKPGDVQSLAAALDSKVDLLVNNAGIMTRESLDKCDYAQVREQFDVNALGPLMVTLELYHRQKLAKDAKVAIITSRMGSIADNTSGGRYGYRMSKAAVNMAGVSLARDLKPKGIAVGLFHPGRVATDMLGPDAKVGVNETVAADFAVKGLLARFAELNLQNTGSFWHAQGQILPW